MACVRAPILQQPQQALSDNKTQHVSVSNRAWPTANSLPPLGSINCMLASRSAVPNSSAVHPLGLLQLYVVDETRQQATGAAQQLYSMTANKT
jgi:hypothetical protein